MALYCLVFWLEIWWLRCVVRKVVVVCGVMRFEKDGCVMYGLNSKLKVFVYVLSVFWFFVVRWWWSFLEKLLLCYLTGFWFMAWCYQKLGFCVLSPSLVICAPLLYRWILGHFEDGNGTDFRVWCCLSDLESKIHKFKDWTKLPHWNPMH